MNWQNEITVSAEQTPGLVTFDNYEQVKAALENGLSLYKGMVYAPEQIDSAKEDRKQLKALKKRLADKEKELEAAYTLPFQDVKAKLDELIGMIDEPLKIIDSFIKTEESAAKRRELDAYARKKAAQLGDYAERVLNSPAFKNPKWENATYTVKKCHDEIDGIISRAATDIRTIHASAGKHAPVLMARYFETLSMDGSKEFLEAIENSAQADTLETEAADQVRGYKVLKITGTEDQMAGLLMQLDLMGMEYEELEDGMPREMKELTEPDFDSFVAFDIETTGSFGAASGDDEAGITEIGAVRVVNGEVVETFDELANPGREIVPRIARITHITNEMIADKPPIDEVMKRFAAFCGDSVLVGHNIKSSDLHYIGKAAKKAGVRMENPFLDTYILAKRFKEQMGWEKLNLGYLAGRYGFEHKEAHRAWSDAEVNVGVYFELKKLCGR